MAARALSQVEEKWRRHSSRTLADRVCTVHAVEATVAAGGPPQTARTPPDAECVSGDIRPITGESGGRTLRAGPVHRRLRLVFDPRPVSSPNSGVLSDFVVDREHEQQDVRRGGGERGRAQDRRRVPQGQVPDELRGGHHPGPQVRADPAARVVGVRPLVAGLAGVREVDAVRQALQPVQEPRRRAPGPRDAQPLRPRRVRALHARQPLPRHLRRGRRARALAQVRGQVRRRRGQRQDRQDAQRPLPHQEVRVACLQLSPFQFLQLLTC